MEQRRTYDVNGYGALLQHPTLHPNECRANRYQSGKRSTFSSIAFGNCMFYACSARQISIFRAPLARFFIVTRACRYRVIEFNDIDFFATRVPCKYIHLTEFSLGTKEMEWEYKREYGNIQKKITKGTGSAAVIVRQITSFQFVFVIDNHFSDIQSYIPSGSSNIY